jgi:hypothetical protein
MSNRVPNSKRVEQITTLVVRGRRRIVTLVTRRANSRFDPDDLHGSVIAIPLLERMRRAEATTVHPVVIDLNYRYPQGLTLPLPRSAATLSRQNPTLDNAHERSRATVMRSMFSLG